MPRRYERQTLYRPPGVDMSRAQTAGQLSQALLGFRDRAASIGTQIATKRGAEAGAETEGTPELRSNATAFGRAYNNAAVRNYVISQYSDLEQQAARIEDAAGTDPDKFRVEMEGVRRGAITQALPAARAELNFMYQRRMAEGVSRITNARITQQRQTNKAYIKQGGETLEASISRKLASGDPNLLMEAEEDEVRYKLMVDGAVNSGDITPAEAIALKGGLAKKITYHSILGIFERSEDPVSIIGQVMDMPIEKLSDDEKQSLVSDMFTRLNQRQALLSEQSQIDALELKQQYAEGEKAATQLLVDGKLSIQTVSRMLSEDRLDPSVARTLMNELQSGSDRPDDARERFHVETNVLSFTEEQIRDNPRLSWDTKRALIDKRRDESTGWKSTQQAKEGADRIDRALGIVPGVDTRMLSDSDRRARDQALTEWYDVVDGLPDEERQFKAIEAAGTVIQKVIRSNAGNEASRLEQRLRSYQSDKDPTKLKGAALKEYNDTVTRYQRQIDEARRRSQQ